MNFGFRTPSLRKRIAARTSWKRVVRHRMGLKAPRGWGWLTNPRKAAYNRIYYRTTVDPVKILLGGRTGRRAAARQSGGLALLRLLVVVGIVWIGVKAVESGNSATSSSPHPTTAQSSVPTAPISTVQRYVAPNLEERLKAALAAYAAAQKKLTAAQAAVRTRISQSAEYQTAQRHANEAFAPVQQLRTSHGDGLDSASQKWIGLAGVPNRMLASAYASDSACRSAHADLDRKTAEIAELRKQIAELQRLASQQGLAAQQKAQSDNGTSALGGQTYSNSLSGSSRSSSGLKTEHVSGYSRTNGRYVNSYNRRPSK